MLSVTRGTPTVTTRAGPWPGPTLENPMSPGGSQASAGEGLSPCNIGWQSTSSALPQPMRNMSTTSESASCHKGLRQPCNDTTHMPCHAAHELKGPHNICQMAQQSWVHALSAHAQVVAAAAAPAAAATAVTHTAVVNLLQQVA